MDDVDSNVNENKWRKIFSCSTVIFSIWLLLTGLSIAAFTITLLHASRLPDFSDPHKGFETRGTLLSGRASALDNLVEASRPSSFLTSNPVGRKLLQGRMHRERLSAWLKVPFHPLGGDNDDDGQISKVHTHMVMVNPENATVKYPTSYEPVLPALAHPAPMPAVAIGPTDPLAPPAMPALPIEELPAAMVPPGVGQVAQGSVKTHPTSDVRNRGGEDNDIGTVTTADYDENEDEEEEEGMYGAQRNHSHQGHEHFCSQPTWSHASLVVSHKSEGLSLWNLDSVRELCQLTRDMEPLYVKVCESKVRDVCCPAWSLPGYLALATNHTSCDNITQEDLDWTHNLLVFCAPFFHNLELECMEGEGLCQFAPARCTRHAVVRTLMNFILDTEFLPPNGSGSHRQDLRYVQVVLPVARSTRSLDFYQQLQQLDMSRFKHIKIVAMDLGLKNFVFDTLLVRDSVRAGVVALLVVTLLLLATVRHAAMVLLGLLNLLLTLALSYWIYCEVLGAQRFPFLNLMAALLLLAVGTDNVVFVAQGWGERCDKKLRDKVCGLSSLWLSVAATSFTTAAAMFAARLSSVTSIALFSIFAGSTLLLHLAMTLLWLLPSVVIAEKLSGCCKLRPLSSLRLPALLAGLMHRADSMLKTWILWTVTRLPCVCITIMAIFTIAASYAILVSPRLQAPDSKNFALFRPDHPFERYESDFSESFWFERHQRSARDILTMTWVWGVKPRDLRDSLDPLARPNASALIFDDTFDITKPKAQVFLLRFCRQLKRQSFYKPTLGPLLPNCFIESLINYMSRRCFDHMDNIDRKPCCETSKFPYSAHTFTLCLQQAMKDLHNTPAQFFMPGLAGPKFDTRTNLSVNSAPQAIVVQFDSSRQFSLSHQSMEEFYFEVESWTQKMLRSAPRSMKGGFFTSELAFYDLQDKLMTECLTSVLVAAGICSLVLYLVTWNIVVSLLAVTSVYSTICSSLAMLALLGWRLNVLESLAVTMAAGLSVDYILHYAIKYNAHLDQELRIKYLIYKNINPIFISTLTTLLTGVILLTSDILAFNQIGIFLIILTFNSFIFSNFGFLCLLYKFGPNFKNDIEYCRRIWTINEMQDEVNVTSQAPLSDSNSVTLTGLPPLSPELHELENMSPTFLEDPGPGTNIFDTPAVPESEVLARLENARKVSHRQPEIAILEPLLQHHQQQ